MSARGIIRCVRAPFDPERIRWVSANAAWCAHHGCQGQCRLADQYRSVKVRDPEAVVMTTRPNLQMGESLSRALATRSRPPALAPYNIIYYERPRFYLRRTHVSQKLECALALLSTFLPDALGTIYGLDLSMGLPLSGADASVNRLGPLLVFADFIMLRIKLLAVADGRKIVTFGNE